MRHDPDDRYEPETGWCSECGKACTIIGIDEGIGPYEFWGQKGRNIDIRPASDCCEASVLEYEPELTEPEGA